MRLMVTGSRGYIGVEMVTQLLAKGHDVVGLDNGLYEGCDFVSPPDDIDTLVCDIRDVTAADLQGFDAILHLAALSNDPLSDLNPKLTFDINLGASVALARSAKAAGVGRFLFSSSCSLYGAGNGEFLDENAPFNPVTPYGESKVLVEQALSGLADGDFCPVYLRNATAYGVSRRLRADIVVNNLVAHAVTSGKIVLQSDGTPWRPLVHIRDIIHAFECVLEAPRETVWNAAFNVGRTAENYQVRDVARIVGEVVPNCEVVLAEGASPDARDYRVDFTKIETKLPGFCPRWNVRGGVEEIYEAFASGAMSRSVFEGPLYFRLRRIRQQIERGLLSDELRTVSSRSAPFNGPAS